MKQNQAEYARRGLRQPVAINAEKDHGMNNGNALNYAADQTMNMNFWAVFALSFLQQEQQMHETYKPAANEFSRVAA